MIQFEGMVDFQYLPESKEKLSFSPYIFSRFDKEFSYKFKENPQSLDVTIQKQDGTIEKKKKIVNAPSKTKTILQTQFDIPFHPPNPPNRTKEIEEFDKVLNNLFEKREIWSFRALKTQCLSEYERRKLKSLIGYHAFYILNGPFRALWCKYGVNPSLDSKYAKYQNIDLRVPPNLREKIQGKEKSNPSKPTRMKKENTPYNEDLIDFVFDDIPQQYQVYYQLCDIPLYSFQELMDDKNEECDKVSGWFSKGTLDKMRELLKKKLELWLEKGIDGDQDIFSATKLFRNIEKDQEVIGNDQEIENPEIEVLQDEMEEIE